MMFSIINVLALLAYKIDTKHRNIALSNLDLAFGQTYNAEEKTSIVKESYKNLLYSLYWFLWAEHVNLKDFESTVTITNEHYIEDAVASQKPIILITAHYGNWELLSTIIGLRYKRFAVVGRPMNNELLNEDLRRIRNQHNSYMIDREGASKALVKALKTGDIVGLVIDQHIGANRGGIPIDFFNHRAMQSDSTSRLAIKFDALIIPVFTITDDFNHYEIKFYPPIDTSSQDIQTITQLQANVMQEQISSKPQLWFWQHKRWKEFYNHIYTR